MSPKKIVVTKVFGQWIGSCPACTPEKGFMAHTKWQLVQMWSVSHADKHRKPERLTYVEGKRHARS